MIKRYDIDPRAMHWGLVRDDGGEYVRYADIAHLLEEKTIEEHRSEFEQWAAKEGLRMNKRGNGDYVAPFTAIAWKAWQAAKGVKK